MTKRILITGTSSGFGNEAAIALAQHGHTVFATMREADSKNAPAVHQLRDMESTDALCRYTRSK